MAEQIDSYTSKKIWFLNELLDKKRSEIIKNAIRNNIPDADIIKLFSLKYQQDKISDKTSLANDKLLGFGIDELKITEVKLGVEAEFYYRYNKVIIVLVTPYEDAIEFEAVTGKLEITKELETKLMPIIEEIKMAKKEYELSRREQELDEREKKLKTIEEALDEKEKELRKREEELRKREEEFEEMKRVIAKALGLTSSDNDYDEEDP
jgi:hypothetical protein